MALKPPSRSSPIKRVELLNILDATERSLARLIGRWDDDLPGEARLELHKIDEPLLNLLLRLGRRP